jgi:hypothetical protein
VKIPDVLSPEYLEVAYMLTRVTDAACVGIVELVVSLVERRYALEYMKSSSKLRMSAVRT